MADLFQQYGQIHGKLLILAWYFLQNILIWSQYFKFKTWSIYVHMGCAIFISLLHTAGTLMMLIAVQFNIRGLHEIPGFSVLLLLLFILGSGSICYHNITSSHPSPTLVYISNKMHPIFGWIIIIAAKIALYQELHKKIFLLIDIISHLAYLILKIIPNKPIFTPKTSEIRKIKNKNGLKIYGNNYFMYANKVYSTDQLIGQHPGGWKLINAIKGREVDRFIYGVEPIQQFPDIGTRAHSLNSIQLADQPMASYQNSLTYRNMQEQNPVTIQSISKISEKSNIYLVYLQSNKSEQLEDLGYHHISQIGQYYALRSGNTTRLYTAVNFLHKHNISIMQKIDNKIKSQRSIVSERQSSEGQKVEARNLLPLLIKRYEKGTFTSKNINSDNHKEMILSRNRGFGLNLQGVSMGKILIFGGGTGINPFCDLIDLLFKNLLIKGNHVLSATVKAYDSLLNTSPFQNLNFTFYFAAAQLDQIHPITLYQLDKISKSFHNKCFLKIKNMDRAQLENYANLEETSTRFEQILGTELENRTLSQIYICGPTRMTKSLLQVLKDKDFDPDKYTIV